MARQDLATALQRAESALRRRPALGIHQDAPATARWHGGTRIVASHSNGTQVEADMPTEVGGTGDRVTPGWLFRAGFASCVATRIAMGAASAGIDLDTLEVVAGSHSDTRGLLGMSDEGGCVTAAPRDVQLHVRISARGVAPERLRRLVEDSNRCSPMSVAMQTAIPFALHIQVEGH